jgi:DNA-directed RNA polymerase specialized sigma24 family protein
MTPRKKEKRHLIPLDLSTNPEQPPGADDALFFKQAVNKALAVLTPRERFIVIAYTIDEKTYEEIGASLPNNGELSGGRVSQLLFRSMRRMRERLTLDGLLDAKYAKEFMRNRVAERKRAHLAHLREHQLKRKHAQVAP